ncbi:hypothetical protein [Arthrobacter sp. MMS24-S77]
MIIQAGFDLQILARPLIDQEEKLYPRPVVIGLDADMHNIHRGTISRTR